MRKSRVFALGVIGVVALRLLSEVPSQLRAQHDARRRRAARAARADGADGAAEASSLLMYDGVCNLCNGFVNWSRTTTLSATSSSRQQQHMDMLERLGAPESLHAHPRGRRRVLPVLVRGAAHDGAHGPALPLTLCASSYLRSSETLCKLRRAKPLLDFWQERKVPCSVGRFPV